MGIDMKILLLNKKAGVFDGADKSKKGLEWN